MEQTSDNEYSVRHVSSSPSESFDSGSDSTQNVLRAEMPVTTPAVARPQTPLPNEEPTMTAAPTVAEVPETPTTATIPSMDTVPTTRTPGQWTGDGGNRT